MGTDFAHARSFTFLRNAQGKKVPGIFPDLVVRSLLRSPPWLSRPMANAWSAEHASIART
jgi:hypothetical protein